MTAIAAEELDNQRDVTPADMSIGSTGSLSMRSHLSLNSKKFFLTRETGASVNIIIQANTIHNPAASPLEAGTPGSLIILDNQFLDLDANFNVLSFCNRYSVANHSAAI